MTGGWGAQGMGQFAQQTAARPTLRQLRELRDTFSGNPKQVRNLDRFVSQSERAWRQRQLDAYAKRGENLKQRKAETLAGLEAVLAEMRDLTSGARTGRYDSRVVRRQAASCRNYLDQLREHSTEGRSAGETAWTEVCADPATYQEQTLRDLPALTQSLPPLTQDFLDGTGPDPFAS